MNLTLADLLSDQVKTEPLYQFFELVHEHEDEFAAGEFLESKEPEFEYSGADIGFPLLDAITFGILWEQQTPSETRQSPDATHFDFPRGFSSTEELREAQPHAAISNFYLYLELHSSGPLDEEASPPPAVFQNVNISPPLRNAILFGQQWEIWYADDLEDDRELTENRREGSGL